MQASDIPAKSAKVFAASATATYVRAIPQTTADPAAASFDLGFPPQTFTDEGAGGTPPDGRDVNGILQYCSAWTRWFQAGGAIPYDPTFQAAIGGYPISAVVESATTGGLRYRSTVNNNTTNPDTGGAGWMAIYPNALAQGSNGNGKWRRYPIGGGLYELAQRGKLVGPFTGEQTLNVTFPTAFAAAPDIEGISAISYQASYNIFGDLFAQPLESTVTASGFSIELQQQGSTSFTVQGVSWSAVAIYTP